MGKIYVKNLEIAIGCTLKKVNLNCTRAKVCHLALSLHLSIFMYTPRIIRCENKRAANRHLPLQQWLCPLPLHLASWESYSHHKPPKRAGTFSLNRDTCYRKYQQHFSSGEIILTTFHEIDQKIIGEGKGLSANTGRTNLIPTNMYVKLSGSQR